MRSLWTRILWGRALMKSLLWHCHATTNLSGRHLENRTSWVWVNWRVVSDNFIILSRSSETLGPKRCPGTIGRSLKVFLQSSGSLACAVHTWRRAVRSVAVRVPSSRVTWPMIKRAVWRNWETEGSMFSDSSVLVVVRNNWQCFLSAGYIYSRLIHLFQRVCATATNPRSLEAHCHSLRGR